jgi:hypothetical protein
MYAKLYDLHVKKVDRQACRVFIVGFPAGRGLYKVVGVDKTF